MKSLKIEELWASFPWEAKLKIPKAHCLIDNKSSQLRRIKTFANFSSKPLNYVNLLTRDISEKNYTENKTLSFQQYVYAKEAAFIMKIFSQTASHMLIKAFLKHILLWTTNEWLTKLIHIFTVKTIPPSGTHNTSVKKKKKKKKFMELNKCIC